jgi:TolA-binding protein
MKNTAGEVKMMDRIAAEYPKNPQAPKALYASGEIFYKAKDADKAREYYRKVTDLYPDSSESNKARKRLAAIIMGKI